jgi:hypothetical protein
MDIDDLLLHTINNDPLKIQDAVNQLMAQKAGEMVVQRRDEMAQSVFGGLPQQEVDDQSEAGTESEEDSEETFSDEDIDDFLDQNLEDLLQDLDNIEAENDTEDSQ